MRLPELRCQATAHARDTVHTAKMPEVRCHNDKRAVDNGVEIVSHPNPILRTHATPVERNIYALLGRVVQHEIDHLNGVLTIDHGPAEEYRSAKQDDA